MKHKTKIIFNKSLTTLKHTGRVIFHFVSKNIKRKEVIIALAAFPAVILWSMVVYRYIATPRAPQIREAGSDSNYLYVAGSNIFGAKFGDSKTNAPKVEFTLPKSDKSVTFYPANTNKSLVKPVREDKEIKFIDVYENIDFSYKTLPFGVKEDIIIKKPGSASTFPFYLDTKNVTPKYFTEKLAGGVFYDENKNYIFHFEKPFAIDAAGKRTEKVDISIKRDAQTQKLMAILTVDRTWLNDPTREYPVYVDPTVIHDTSSEFATGTLNRVKDTGSGSSPVLETYYQELPANQYTVGLWHMNEASGTTNVADSSGRGNTGTSTSSTNVTTGLLNDARSFNGTSDSVSAGTTSTLDFSSAFTIEAWVYRSPTQNSVDSAIVAKIGNSPYNGYMLWYRTDNTIDLYINGGARADSTYTIPASTWTHVVGVWTGSFAQIYINGQLSVSSSYSTAPTSAGQTFWIGRYSDSPRFFTGTIDDVRVSNVARTPEEIAQDASRRPYSVYTSDVIDLSQTVASWNSLSWTELGVATGDGESLKDTTGLVAQWNFNEITGKTAAVATGSCGSTCNGTLTNFGPTDSQDGTTASSWTADNKRWGTGALMFDGSNDQVIVPSTSSLSFSNDFSYGAWIKTTSTSAMNYLYTASAGSQLGMSCGVNISTSGKVQCRVWGNPDTIILESTSSVNDGQWHYIVYTRSGTNYALYIDGVLNISRTDLLKDFLGSAPFYIGSSVASQYFNGIIDSTSVYSRALTASEILSNYNSSNLELQTRVGNDSSPNDGGWEDWSPTTNETAIESFDSNPDSDNYTNLLLHGDANDNSTTFRDNSNSYSPHTLTANGDAQIDTALSKFGGSSMLFDGTGDYVSTPDSTDWNLGDGDFTIDFWVRFNALPALGGGTNVAQNFVAQTESTTKGWAAMLWVWSGDNTHYRLNFHSKDVTTNSIDKYWDTVEVNTWYHISIVRSSGVINMFVDGTSIGSGAYAYTVPDVADELRIGSKKDNIYVTGTPFNGWLDEFRITKGLARWTSGFTAPSSAYENPTVLGTSTDTTIKMEGSASEKIVNNRSVVDGSTVALWHMEETGGSGAYIKDSSPNANNGTPTNTTVANGISGKARNFDGSGDYIEALQATSPTAYTLEAWVKPTSLTSRGIVVRTNSSGPGASWSHQLRINSSGNFEHYTWDGGAKSVSGTTTAAAGKWYHVVGTATNGGNMYLFVNGVQEGTPVAVTTLWTGGDRWHLGSSSGGSISTFDGTIDEIRISSVARSADEVAESYRMGRDHYINKTISSTDLSGKNTIPFYVAADRPGTYLTTTTGESAYANYQPDENTVGLWHMDDPKSGNNSVLKFVSTNSTEGNSYAYYKAIAGQSTVVATNDTIEYDVYLSNALANTGTIDVRFIDTNYLRYYVSCHTGTYTAGTWHHIKWSIPSALNGGTIDWIDLVNENDTATTSTVYYDNFVVRNSAGAIKTVLYSSGTTTYNTLEFESNAANTQTLTTSAYQTEGIVEVDQSIDTYIRDSSGNGNNGTPEVTVMGQGKIGKARNFNGTTANITPVSAPAVSANGDWTYELWVKFNVAPTGGYILDRTTATNNVISLIADGSGFYFQKRYDDNTGLTTTASGSAPVTGQWYHLAVARNYNSNFLFYINGQLATTITDTGSKTLTAPIFKLGTHQNSSSGTNGAIDEFRISNIARSASDIRAAYEVGKRTHDVTIDFGAKLSADDLITGSGDTGFEVDATYYGLSQQADQLFKGDKIIVRENYDGTEYIAQGTVTAVNASTGAVTVASWDAGSTFPSGGYTANASVFKWQREYWNITEPIDSQVDAITNLSLRLTDGTEGRTIWIDDLRSAGDYLTTPTGSEITSSTGYRYLQYRVIGHSSDPAVSATLSSVTLDYADASPTAPTNLLAESASNPAGITDTTPEFSAICNDPNSGDILNKYQIQVDNNADFLTPVWDSGASGTAMTNCTEGTRSTDISFGGTPLTLDGTTYYWRIKFWDDDGSEGAWSNESTFFVTLLESDGRPSNCRVQETTDDDSSLTLLWTDNSTTETQFRIEKDTNAGGFVLLIGNKPADSVSHTDSSVSSGNTYQYRVRAEGATNSEWCTTPTVSLQVGTIDFNGLNLKGLTID